jgi:hypothetical protein
MASEINYTFKEEYSSLTEEQKNVLNTIKVFNDITDEMLGFFPTTNSNLMSKTNDELNTILEEVQKMPTPAPAPSNDVPSTVFTRINSQ